MERQAVTRRGFLKGTVAVLTATGLGSVPWSEVRASESGVLKGFVVADSHFGWVHGDQPSNEQVAQAVDTIIGRFPDLDLFVDTGDAIHGIAGDDARGEWTDFLQNRCGTVPFYYVNGNHEISPGAGRSFDVEMHINRMGSIPCRPYYSFDIKGIHFVSLPELMMESYITDEELAWLALDLEVHKGKTTVIFTHNSISHTTLPHDDLGYRRLANSLEVYEFINRYPNIVAWMHGHNHTWEIVRRGGKLYVSNGRIGGFNPPFEGNFGRDHLGGMYFEAGPDYFVVKGFSATDKRFFDEIEGYKHLTQRLDGRTSFDADAEPSICYGVGGACDGRRIPVYNHYLGGDRRVYFAGADGSIINENSDFASFSQRTMPNWKLKLLPGFSVNPYIHDDVKTDHFWEWTDPGLKLLPLTDRKPERVIVMPENGQGERCYYRIAPGGRYRMTLEIESETPGPKAQVKFRVHDRNLKEVFAASGPEWAMTGGRQVFETDFQVPELRDVKSIYTDPASDNVFHAMAEIRIGDLTQPVVIRRIELRFADAGERTENPAVTVDGKRFDRAGILDAGKAAEHKLEGLAPARSVVEVEADGNRRLTWLIRHAGVRWQVRHAAVEDHGDWFEVGPLRNTFSTREEIVILPVGSSDGPFVHRMRHVNRAKIHPASGRGREIRIDLVENLGSAEVEVLSSRHPQNVRGADDWSYADGRVLLKKSEPGTIGVRFPA